MNFNLPYLPKREDKPRNSGVTMVMDKGLSMAQTRSLIESAGKYTDLLKFGFGTSLLTCNLKEKINLYKNAGIVPYFGGTLFEAFVIRDMFGQYKEYLKKYEMQTVEVSDGSMVLDHATKLEYITELAKDFTVLSEVGSKQANVVIPDEEWIVMMEKELQAGAWKVIAEARESGNVGIYKSDQSANNELINGITAKIEPEKILWEAPNKKQQVWFIKQFGSQVNLGNIAPAEVIPLETLRLGLRGDTFFDFLPSGK